MFVNNYWSLTKSKYIDIKYQFVKGRVQNGQLSIEYIGTNSMIADPLTKAVLAKVFREHTAYMDLTSYENMQFQWEFFWVFCGLIM